MADDEFDTEAEEKVDRWLRQQRENLIEQIAESMDLEFGFQHSLMMAEVFDILEHGA